MDMPHLRGRTNGRLDRNNNNSDEATQRKREDKLERADSNKGDDSNEPNHVEAKRTRRQPKIRPKWEGRQVEGCQICRGKEKVVEGLGSRQADKTCDGVRARRQASKKSQGEE